MPYATVAQKEFGQEINSVRHLSKVFVSQSSRWCSAAKVRYHALRLSMTEEVMHALLHTEKIVISQGGEYGRQGVGRLPKLPRCLAK